MQFEKNYDRKAMVEMEANGGYDTEAGADYAVSQIFGQCDEAGREDKPV